LAISSSSSSPIRPVFVSAFCSLPVSSQLSEESAVPLVHSLSLSRATKKVSTFLTHSASSVIIEISSSTFQAAEAEAAATGISTVAAAAAVEESPAARGGVVVFWTTTLVVAPLLILVLYLWNTNKDKKKKHQEEFAQQQTRSDESSSSSTVEYLYFDSYTGPYGLRQVVFAEKTNVFFTTTGFTASLSNFSSSSSASPCLHCVE
jgi:hypothetical protein